MRTICAGIAPTLVAHASFAQDAPKRPTGDDLFVQTHKWDGKKLQTNVECFYFRLWPNRERKGGGGEEGGGREANLTTTMISGIRLSMQLMPMVVC